MLFAGLTGHKMIFFSGYWKLLKHRMKKKNKNSAGSIAPKRNIMRITIFARELKKVSRNGHAVLFLKNISK